MHPKRPHRDLEKTVARLAEQHAEHARSFLKAPGQTIRPTVLGRIERRRATGITADPGLQLGAVLGEGGMGVVRVGRQHVLRRDVAVKTLQPRLKSEFATQMLMQEALVIGRLEHPNVLPIYDIRHDDDGPQLVLKKIDGVQWLTLMHDAAAVQKQFGVTDLLA